MKIHRIYGVLLRYLYLYRHSLDRISDAFYWPAVDLILWGLTSLYFSRNSSLSGFALSIMVSGILFWIIVWRGQYEITVGLLEDLWNRNLINTFASPLRFSEWVIALLLLGFIKAVVSGLFAAFLAWLFYSFEIFNYGLSLIPFFLLLLMSGWWIGFMVAGCIMRYGTKIQHLAWSAVYFLAPFSAVYYPLEVLPQWAQYISAIVPMSYIFEGARMVLKNGSVDGPLLAIAFALNAIYFVLGLTFLWRSFQQRLQKGLMKAT